MLTFGQRVFIRLLVWLPVLTMVALGAIHVVGQVDRLLSNVGWVLSDELSTRLERKVVVGKASLLPLGGAHVRNLRIAQGKSFPPGTMLVAKNVTVRYNLGELLAGKGGGSVKSVVVTEPTVALVRNRGGVINVLELVKTLTKPQVGPKGPPFKGKVTMSGGRVILTDYFRRATRPPATLDLSHANASFDAARSPRLVFVGSASGKPGQIRRLRISGEYDTSSRMLRADATAQGANAPLLVDFAGVGQKIDIRRGTVDAELGVATSVPLKGLPAISGVVKVSGAEIQPPGIRAPINNVSGTILLSGQSATVNLAGTLSGSRAVVSGVVSNIARPEFGFAVSSPSIDLPGLLEALGGRRLPRGVQVSGFGGLAANVAGTRAAPTATGSATARSVTAFGYSVKDVSLAADYANGVLALKSVSFTFGGARAQASGTVETGGARSLCISGSIRGLPLEKLKLPPSARARGLADADFSVTGSIAKPQVAVGAKVARGQVSGVPFAAASVDFTYDVSKRRAAGKASANVAEGYVSLSGSGGPSWVDFDYDAQAVDISTLASLLKQPGLEGVVYTNGHVTGKPSDPLIKGNLEVFKGRYKDYQIDYTRLAFAGNKHEMDVSEGIARIFPAELAFAGKVSGIQTDRIEFRGDAHARRLQVERLMELTGKSLEVTGTVTGDFTFSGAYLPKRKPEVSGQPPLTDVVASGTLSLEDGTAYGFIINKAGAKLEYANDKIILSDTQITSSDAKIVLSGTADLAAKTIDLGFQIDGFDLARIRDRLEGYVAVGGIVNSNGTIKGPFDRVVITADAGIDKLTIDEVRFDEASFQVAYSNDKLLRFSTKLARENQLFEFSGTGLDLATNCLESLSGRVVEVLVPDLWTMFVASPYLASEQAKPVRDALRRVPRLSSGVANGSFDLSGCLTAPEGQSTLTGLNGSVNVTVDNVGVDVRKIEKIALHASLSKGVVTLNQASAIAGDTYVQLAPITPGTPVYANGEISLAATANNLDLSRLRPWLGENTPSGIATVEFTFAGNYQRPDIRGSVEVMNPGIRSLTFDSLRVSQIMFAKGQINVQDVILSVKGHQIVAQGYVPWSWDEFGISRDRPLEFTARLANEDLTILGALSPLVDVYNTRGPLTAEVRIAGTIAAPSLSGAVLTHDGVVALKGFTNTFQNVDVDISFDGGTATFNAFSAQSSEGGSLSIQPKGTITLTGQEKGYAEFNLILATNGLVLSEKNAFGYTEDIKMQVDSGLSIGGTLYEPLIQEAEVGGLERGVLISNATMQFAIPEGGQGEAPTQLPIRPRFIDVGIRLGDNVRVEPPMMALLVGGSGAVAGTLGEQGFNAYMELEVKEGDMTLPETGTRLRIIPGAKMVVRVYSPPTPPELVLTDFRATTSVMATSPLGRRDRYQITVEASGPVSNLNIELKSDPPGLSREQILAALGHVEGLFAAGEGQLQKELANALTAVGTSALFMPIQKVFVEKFGFEEFSLDYSPITPLSLYASRRLFDNFFVSFYQRLQAALANVSDYEWQFRFGYRFKTFYSVSVGIDDQQTLTGDLGFTKAFW